jgi:hypothetical protein
MVTLDTASHTYSDSNGVEYKSVTTFIKEFSPKFDFVKKSTDYAAKHGMDVEEVRASWNLKRTNSTDFGTLIHSQIENSLIEENYKVESKYECVVSPIVESIKTEFVLGNCELKTERCVYNKEHKIAGTSDLIIDYPIRGIFSVADFKTNKQINYSNMFDRWMLDPIKHIPNSEYFKYSLQLSFYAYFYSLHSRKQLDRLFFYWLKRKNAESYDDLDGSEWVRFNVPYLKEEVISMLEYAKG